MLDTDHASASDSQSQSNSTPTPDIMSRGISTNKRVTDRVACLRQQGINFVCRYYSHTTQQPQKRITPDEAAAILQAGMRIVTVYEDGPTQAGYFTSARGRADATHAYGAAQAIAQPSGSAIYFAVDYDATNQDTRGPISEYFEGVKEGLSGAGKTRYTVGVYGSGRVCGYIKEQQSLAVYSWLAESTGWAGSGTYATYNIKQLGASHTLCDLRRSDYEDNVATAEYGAFGHAGEIAQPTPKAAPQDGQAKDVGFSQRLAEIAREQYETYHQYTENDEPLRGQIRRYWEDIGFTFPGIATAWSAVFISWCVRQAGASPVEFKPSNAHSRFVYRAIQNQNQGVGVFRGRRLEEYQPKVGDILQNNRNGQRLTYDFASLHEAYESHSAIVVHVGSDDNGRFIRTIGGNESDSVGIKRVALTNEGYVMQRNTNPFICLIEDRKT